MFKRLVSLFVVPRRLQFVAKAAMPTLIITVDPDCCRCSIKIQKILCCIQEREEFVIDKIVYDKDKVIVSGPFDATKLSCRLYCKAGKIIKNIEEPPPPPPPKKPEKPKPEPPCKLIPFCPYPWPSPCSCPPPPPPPKPEPCKVVPFAFPYPYPQQPAWPCGCPPPYCQCPAKPPPPAEPPKPEPEPPAPEPPKPPPPPPPCQCPAWQSCRCWGAGYPPPMPYYPMVVCDDNPSYGACAIM